MYTIYLNYNILSFSNIEYIKLTLKLEMEVTSLVMDVFDHPSTPSGILGKFLSIISDL